MNAQRPLPTLRQVLSHVHFRVTLFAAGITGLAVMLTGFATIAFYANQNLRLVANTTSYAVAPAVVFDDPHAVAISIAPIGQLEGVGGITVLNRDGNRLGSWAHRPARRGLLGLNAVLTRLVFPNPVRTPIVHQGQNVGTVIITGEAGPVAGYIGSGALAALACLVITAIASRLLAQRLMKKVVDPLSAIEQVAHAVRQDRAFEQRVPPAEIAEIDNLGDDFNALLAELEDWHSTLRQENADLSHQALHDPLTGLPNRAHFDRALDEMLREAQRDQNTFAMLYLDGDDFKAVNDRCGHAAGDVVLKEIGTRLLGIVRREDLAARLGGDEFAILLKPGSDAATVAQINERLREALGDPIVLPSGEPVSIALSTGAAIFPRDGEDVRALVHHADLEMYASKRAHRSADKQESQS